MFYKTTLAAACLTALSSPVFAQGITGGELTIDTYGFSEGDDPTAVNYSGSLEYAINRDFSVAGAISIYDFSLLDDNITNITLHGIYHVNDSVSVGGFIGRDSADMGDATFYGIEGGYEVGKFEMEGYLASYDNMDSSTVLGLSGKYQVTESISAIGNLGYGDVATVDLTRFSAGAEYTFAQGPSVYAEVGQIDGAGFNSSFIGLGASIEFGAERGTTFDRRGIFESINPGF